MGGECGMHGWENECGILVGKPEGERRFGRIDAGGKIILKIGHEELGL
jgi:hypothetical protein